MLNTYYVAKLNINGNIFTNSKNLQEIKGVLIPNRIKQFKIQKNDNRFYTYRNHIYTLANISELSENILEGDIIKEIKTTIQELRGSKTEKRNVDDSISIHFFYIISEELIFIEKNQYYRDSILEIFGNLISLNNIDIGDIKINLLNRISNIKNFIQKNDIRRITFKYIMPNDPKTDTGVAKILSELNANNATQTFSNSEGLSLTDDNNKMKEYTKEILEFAKKGYGTVIAKDSSGNTIKSVETPKEIKLDSVVTSDIIEEKVNDIKEDLDDEW